MPQGLEVEWKRGKSRRRLPVMGVEGGILVIDHRIGAFRGLRTIVFNPLRAPNPQRERTAVYLLLGVASGSLALQRR